MITQGAVLVQVLNSEGATGQTSTGSFVEATGAVLNVNLEVGDIVLQNSTAGMTNDNAGGRNEITAQVIEPDATTTNLGIALNAQALAGEEESASSNAVFVATQAGRHTFHLMFIRLTAGTTTLNRHSYSAMVFKPVGNPKGQSGAFGNQGSSLSPMGSGQNVLDDPGPFRPS